MAEEMRGAQYGAATPEDLKASGYRQPAWFHKAPEVDADGFPVEKAGANEDGSSQAVDTAVDVAAPEVANKAILPTRAQRKAPAKKKGKK